MKKFAVEIFVIILFLSILWVVNGLRIKDKPNDFKAYRDSLEREIKVLQNNIDSLNQIERIQTIKKTIINNYHDSIQTIIIYLPDSANTKLLLSNIGRYNHLSELSPSQSN